MSRSKVLGSLLSVLLVTTAGGALGQDATGEAVFALTGTGGVSGFNLPAFDTGVFGHTAGGAMLGGMIGGNITAGIGQMDDWDFLVSLSAFGAFGTGSSSWTDTFTSANGPVIVTGLTTPDAGSIVLAPGTADDVTVTGANGGLIDIDSAGGTNNVAAVTPSGPGFINGWATTGVGSAAYGAIADDSGGIFIASGDIDGLSITTDVRRTIAYGGADLTLGLAGQFNGETNVQVYAGPSFRGLGQGITTDITIDIPEVLPSVLTHPEFKISVNDTLTSHYFGGVLGGSASFATSPGMLFTLGLEGGVYSVHANWSGRDTYSTCCGAEGTPLSTVSPTLSVQGPTQTYDFGSTIAFAARGNGAVTWALDENKSFSLGGSVEYLSRVATVNHSGLTQTNALSDDWTTATADTAASTFAWGDMWNFSITGSLTGHF